MGGADPRQSPVFSPVSRHWLNERRLRLYTRLFIALYAAALIGWGLGAGGRLATGGMPLGADFAAFWSASRLAHQGEAAAAYDPSRILAVSGQALPGNRVAFVWSYPPTAFLMVWPFGLLPYPAAYVLWVTVQVALFVFVLHRLAPARETVWCALAFPGLFINVLQGQNGLLSTAVMAGAVLLAERRPLGAGAVIALLAYKPHLALLFPAALVAGRRWRTFLAAMAATLGITGAAMLVAGPTSFLAFWNNLPAATHLTETGALPWHKMPSVLVQTLAFGIPLPLAWAIQAGAALAALAAVIWSWRRQAPLPLAGAVLAAGALLATPHVNDHDLALLGLPIAVLAWDGHRRGWLTLEREVLVAAWLAPLLDAPLASACGVHVGLLATMAVLGTTLRRILGHKTPPSRPEDGP